MSEARKAFESHVNQYDTFGDEWQDKGVDEHFIAGYEAGKAARAGQESEPFAFCFTDVNGKPIEFCDHPKHAAEGDALIRTPLYTHPASADKWIKCSEQRPNVLDVWIKMTDGSVVACWAQLDGDFYWKGGGFESYILEHTVTHWKPRQEEQGHE